MMFAIVRKRIRQNKRMTIVPIFIL